MDCLCQCTAEYPGWPPFFFKFFSFFIFTLFVLHCPVWEIWVALPGCSTAAARAVLPIPTSACSILCVSKQQYGCQCLGFLVCTQMLLMHAMARGLCGHRRRVCAGSLLKEKSLCCNWGLEPASVSCLAFQSDVLPAESSPPHAHLGH